MGAATWEKQLRQDGKNLHQPYDSAILFLGICPRDMKTECLQKDQDKYSKLLFSYLIAPNWKQPKYPSTEWNATQQ